MELAFLGATGTVTGSKYLLRFGGNEILIDCGLFQGLKALRLRNWQSPPLKPKDVNAVVLTHAHLDHSGYLPRFIREASAARCIKPGHARRLRHPAAGLRPPAGRGGALISTASRRCRRAASRTRR